MPLNFGNLGEDGDSPVASEPGVGADQWIVVTFDGDGETMPMAVMDALLETEVAANDALESSGLGFIDGNEIGAGTYDLYFAGADADAMWEVLRPIFEDAPLHWSRVELRRNLEDGAPTVLLPEN